MWKGDKWEEEPIPMVELPEQQGKIVLRNKNSVSHDVRINIGRMVKDSVC